MPIDWALIAKAGGIPKGPTVKQQKAKKDREDAKQLKAFRDAVWLREADCLGWACCQWCGAAVYRGPLHIFTGEVHHRISRRHKATRYDPDNGVLLCNFLVNGCHERVERGEIEV